MGKLKEITWMCVSGSEAMKAHSLPVLSTSVCLCWRPGTEMDEVGPLLPRGAQASEGSSLGKTG